MLIDDLIERWNINTNWTLFLDRDGVINYETLGNYITSVDNFRFIDGAKETIAKLSRIFDRVIVVTNQQGIGKGLMSESDLKKIHKHMLEEIKVNGGRVDQVYHSPFLTAEKNIMQKPGIGMGLSAKKDFPEIDFEKSIMIGNSERDLIFGRQLKMKTVFVGNEKNTFDYDIIINDLKDLIK